MSNNRIILEGCIKGFKESNELNLPESDVFEIFTLSQIHKDRNITYENIINTIVDGGNDGGIDSLMVFIDEELVENIDDIDNSSFTNKTKARFIISQCKKENSFKEASIDKLITTIPILFDLEKNEIALLSRFNSDLVAQTSILIEVWKKTAISGGTISLDYIYATNASEIMHNDVFQQKMDQLVEVTEKCLSSKDVKFLLYSSNELLSLYQKQKSNRLTIDFKDRPLTTEFEDHGIGYIGTVTLANYKQFLTSENGDIRDDLFESNIRHFQGLVDVNKKIKDSVENPTDADFWWLNNGITIIAEEPKEVGKKLSIENIQIVNGLQTSYSIFNNHNGNHNDNRSVLVKVIVNTDKEITDNIIASTNSQNAVAPALLRATEPIQRQIELFFLNEGYYYDRRKNYYKNQGKPASRIFSIEWTAQSILSLTFDEPHLARSSPTSLFKTDKMYDKIFDIKKNFQGYLNCCHTTSKAYSMWSRYDDRYVKSQTANFKLHLACLFLKFGLRKKNPSFDDIVNIQLDTFGEDLFGHSISFLKTNIDSYLQLYPEYNLINIAKSKEFTTYLFNQIELS